MIEALIISNVLLWLAVLALAAVVLALLRQVGVLHERVAPAGALMSSRGPRVGEAAPKMRLADWSGSMRLLGDADPRGLSTLVLFVSPTCPVCKTILSIAESLLRSERDLRLVLASDGPRAEHEAFVAAHRLGRYGYVLSTDLGVAYQVGKLPHAVLIDGAGIVRAQGLVNTREHLESLLGAAERGVASLQEYVGRELAPSDAGGSPGPDGEAWSPRQTPGAQR